MKNDLRTVRLSGNSVIMPKSGRALEVVTRREVTTTNENYESA
jgi:hypothetical protein